MRTLLIVLLLAAAPSASAQNYIPLACRDIVSELEARTEALEKSRDFYANRLEEARKESAQLELDLMYARSQVEVESSPRWYNPFSWF